MLFSSHFFHCNQIGQVVKDMSWRCAHGMPHHHVVRLEVIILVTKVRVLLIN
jgi:hypothetical protein